MSFNRSSFKKQINLAIEEFQEINDNNLKGAINEAFLNVVLKTPVDKGAAKGSWFCSYIGNGGEDSGGGPQDSITRIQIETEKFKAGNKLLLYSNLFYIEELEDGSSEQAPNGMVKTTVAKWPSILRRYTN